MISAESLSAVIGSLAQADAGVAGVDGISADSLYRSGTGGCQEQLLTSWHLHRHHLNDTASQLNQAAAGLNSGAEYIKIKIF